MSKFIHTSEQAAEWSVYRDRWIDIAFRTEPMTEEEKDLCRGAVADMYKLINKDSPRVVFVSSPLQAAIVTSCAQIILNSSNNMTATQDATEAATSASTRDATWAATWAATRDATLYTTLAATRAATRDATRDATLDATQAATWDATRAATEAATEAATQAATWDATWDATWAATDAATDAATKDATSDATRDAIWDATEAATRATTSDATLVATRAATLDATLAATWTATLAATRDATRDATRAATVAATWDATWNATQAAYDKWFVSPYSVVDICKNIAGEPAIKNLNNVYSYYQGGNQWAYTHSFYEWFRHVAKLDIDWSKWIPWNTLGEHSGPRYVTEKFVIISDFPTVLKVDNENRPHSSTGPFCQWKDGFSLYAWHGVRVPAWIIEQPHLITIEKIDGESNAEIRRVMLDRYGFLRYLQEKQAQIIHQDFDEGGEMMKLYSMPTDDDEGQPMLSLYLRNSTPDPSGHVREYVLRVPPTCKTVWEARNWTFNLEIESRFQQVS